MTNMKEVALHAISTMDEKARADFIKLVEMGHGDFAYQIVVANVTRANNSVKTMAGMYRTMPSIKAAVDGAVCDALFVDIN